MPYADADKVKSRAPATLSKESYAVEIPKGIKWADSWVDSRLRSKFEDRLPFCSPIPDQIQEIAADLAAHFVLKGAFAGGGESKTPTLAEDLFERAELALKMLLSGDMVLPKPADETATGPSLGAYFDSGGRKAALANFDLVNVPPGYGPTIPLAPYRGQR